MGWILARTIALQSHIDEETLVDTETNRVDSDRLIPQSAIFRTRKGFYVNLEVYDVADFDVAAFIRIFQRT